MSAPYSEIIALKLADAILCEVESLSQRSNERLADRDADVHPADCFGRSLSSAPWL